MRLRRAAACITIALNRNRTNSFQSMFISHFSMMAIKQGAKKIKNYNVTRTNESTRNPKYAQNICRKTKCCPVRKSFLKAPVSTPASPKKVIFKVLTEELNFCRLQSNRLRSTKLILDTQMQNSLEVSTCATSHPRTSSSL